MGEHVTIVGAGLAGSEAALQLAARGIPVELCEMRPGTSTPVHRTAACAELVCSNSLKGMRADSAAGMLKRELDVLGSRLYRIALDARVPAGGALAVDRERFSRAVTEAIGREPLIRLSRRRVSSVWEVARGAAALIIATGPLTSDDFAASLAQITGADYLAFFDAAAPIVMADSLDFSRLFRQSRYENGAGGAGDYLNAPFDHAAYERFIDALLDAERVIPRSFETRELFQACQPIEEVARAGRDAPRFGALKPVGLIDPATGRRPWAAVQLRAEDAAQTSYNLVGFQTNLLFGEQKRVFRMIPGLEEAVFARFGVMHRNTFVNAPALLDANLRVRTAQACALGVPVHIAGQLAGTEGYCEAIRSGLHAAIAVAAGIRGDAPPALPPALAFGALMAHATDSATRDYQPLHVNFGVMPALDPPVRNKRERYAAFARRGDQALERYRQALEDAGLGMGGAS